MPPKEKKRGGKGKRGDDDSDNEDPLAMMKKIAGDDEPSIAKSKDTKGNKKYSDAKSASSSSAVPAKKDKKKGKGGKRGDDSDDDGEDPIAKLAKAIADSDDEEEVKKPVVKANETAQKMSKKDKKKGKGGKRGDDSDDDDVDPIAKLAMTIADSDDEEEVKKHAVKANETAQFMSKKDKKKGKGGKRGDDSDDDDVDPIAKLAKTIADSDDEEEVKKHVVKANETAQKMSKKDKKKGKGGKRGDDDSDDDVVKGKDDDDEEEVDEEDENEIDKYQQKHQQQKAVKGVPMKVDKKDKKKNRKEKNSNSFGPDDDDQGVGYSVAPNTDDRMNSDKEEDDDDESDDEKKKPSSVTNTKESNGSVTKAATSSTSSRINQNVEKSTTDPLPPSSSTAAIIAVSPLVEPVVTESPLTLKPSATTSNTHTSSSSLSSSSSSSSNAISVPSTSTTTTPSQSKSSPAVEQVVAAPKKVKSKLELKLEKLKLEKAQATALALEQEKIAAAAALIVAEEEAKLKAEREAIELVEKMAALELEKAKELEKKNSKIDDDDEEDDDDDDDEEEESSDKLSNLPPSSSSTTILTPEEEAEKEMRMKATMYGDDVFSEYGHPDDNTDEALGADGGEGITGSGRKSKSKKDEKLSNKAKRKLAKESEAKEREVEYNLLAMKRSIEGAQFAVSQSIIDPNDPQWQNALDIIIPSLSISAHNKELFVNTELNIVHGRRYGLVGPNGAGKSTLLKMIAAGELKIPPRIDYLYVEQEVVADDTTAVDAVLKADKVRWSLILEEKQLLKELEIKADDVKDTRLGEIYELLDQIGASSAEARARRILFGLGFDAEMQIRPTKYFSGGWRMRISLARALFKEPTLLMLDEPTNHLDLNAVIWLDDYLQRWKKTLLVVSHDQDFLNSVCEEIIHLDEKKLVVYRGNYDNFKEQEEVKRKQQQKAWEKQEKRLRELKSKGITKDKAENLQLKSKSREPGARNKKAEAASASSGGLESGESQIELIKRPREYIVAFSFPEVVPINPPLLEVRDVNFRYNSNLPWLFRGINFGIDMTSRICIVGPNGSGKSTIIKLITGEINPPEGEIRRNPRLRVGVYNQHFVDRLPMEEDPVTYLRRLFNEETYQSCRNILGKYGLEGHAHTIPIRDLSGGQKARVVFVELSLMAPHLLFLDEPTNNLDIESIDALCIALKHFNGGVVLVSHDARLIETTDCQLWVVENQNVTPWISGFKDYRETLLRKLEEQLASIIPGGGERPKDKEALNNK